MTALSERLVAALRSHLATGRRPSLPEGSAAIWNAFASLSECRPYSEAGPQPITFSEIDAWVRLMRCPLEPHHVEIVRTLDGIWMANAMARRGEPPAVATPRANLTAGAFDAVFGGMGKGGSRPAVAS